MITNKPWYIKIWEEGEYIDFWAINHILSGAILAKFFLLFGVSFWISLIVSTTFIVLWEIYEQVAKIREIAKNKILDVVTGIFGFFLFFYFEKKGIMTNTIFIFLILIPFVILEVWGYLAYRIKNKIN